MSDVANPTQEATAVAKAQADAAVAIEKAAKLEGIIVEMQKAESARIAKAEVTAALGAIPAGDHGDALTSAWQKLEKSERDALTAVLAKANAIAKSGDLFTERGSDRRPVAKASGAEAQIEARAAEIAKAERIGMPQAIAKAIAEDPQLYAKSIDEANVPAVYEE